MSPKPHDSTPTTAPQAQRRPVTRSFHGRDFIDNYEWLRDKGNPEVIAHLEAENAWTEQVTRGLEQLRENIFTEIRSRVKETDLSVPSRRRGHWYYSRTQEGRNYGLVCRLGIDQASDNAAKRFEGDARAAWEQLSPEAKAWIPPLIPEDSAPDGEEVLLDLDELAAGSDFFSLGVDTLNPSCTLLAYSVDTRGDERFTLYFKNLATGELLDDTLEGVFYDGCFGDDSTFFYITPDEAWRPHKVWRHIIGTPQEQDECIFTEDDERFNVHAGLSNSRDYVMISTASKLTTEIHVLPAAQSRSAHPEVLWPRQPDVEYYVDHAQVAGEDRWIVAHSLDGLNLALGECAALTQATGLTPLAEINQLVAHSETTRIHRFEAGKNHLILSYRRDGLPNAAVMKLDPQAGYTAFVEVEKKEQLSDIDVSGGSEWDAPVVTLVTSSFVTPDRVYAYELSTGAKLLLRERPILGGYNPKDYTAERVWVTARDGQRIPVSLIYRNDLDRTQSQPLVLGGYGAYEASIGDPSVSIARLSYLDRGIIVAIAHVRGGGEMGSSWYHDGRLTKKKNTFFDFIDVADYLLDQGYTTRDRLVATGVSAGGLLMGAVANMGGDRFRAIHAGVPFVDALTTMLKPELPLTVPEWEEWGDPLHDPEVYEYMASYSPYDNVSAQDYPNILATTSLNDTRVLYVEPAKWIAKLREVATGGEFLLKTEMAAGHGGVSGRYDSWRQTAEESAWLIHQVCGATS